MRELVIITTCNRFWRRLSFTLPFWEDSGAEILVAVLPGFENEIEWPLHARPFVCSDPYPDGSALESKAKMLMEVVSSLKISPPSHLLFTDADIVPPPCWFQYVDSSKPFQTARRVEADRPLTQNILANGKLPEEKIISSLPTLEKKVGMGWFQLFQWPAFNAVVRGIDVEHPGYDLFDYEVCKKARALCGEHVIKSPPFLHLWHGDPGSTWKGTDKDW